MIGRELLGRYQAVFGETFTVMLWAQRPGNTGNAMLRMALAGNGPPATDARIAADLRPDSTAGRAAGRRGDGSGRLTHDRGCL
ncbi:MAG TPA: hypothetical protein VD978_17670 [Azospirillum sp.]|nr:hypothetical protein [Azospirillum sp.]